MKNLIELMISKRRHQRVDMIGHNDIFAKKGTLPVEELERILIHSEDCRTRQDARAVACVEPFLNSLGKVPAIFLDLIFTVRRRVHFEPAFPFGFEFSQLFNRERISQMEGHEISDSRLCPMRQIASVHLEFGFAIEERRHCSTHISFMYFSNAISGVVWMERKNTVGTPKLLFARP